MKKNKLTIIIIFLMMLYGCNAHNAKKIVISDEIANTISFLENVKIAYITIGNIVGNNYSNGKITEIQYNKICWIADQFRNDIFQSAKIMFSWYDSNNKIKFNHRKKLKMMTVNLLLDKLDILVGTIINTNGISEQDKQSIYSAINILNKLYR